MASVAQNLNIAPSYEDESIADPIREALERICASPLFSETTRMKRFLRYVVEQTLDGQSHLLKGYSIGLEVFDRPESFDPQADTIVRVQAGQLRRRLDLYYAGPGRSDSVRIMVPKGSYVPKFEMRKLTASMGAPDDMTRESIHEAEIHALDAPVGPGILITNFEVIGGTDADKAFALGMTAEIASALVHFRYLRIVTRTASVSEALSAKSVKELGRSYNAAYALSGSVRRANDLVRVTVNLIETATGRHTYSRTYDRQYTVENLLEIQEEIASYVASGVGAPYGVINKVQQSQMSEKPDIDGYEAVLKFYAFTAQPTIQDYPNIRALLEGATKRHPKFSSAWASLSLMYSFGASQVMFSDENDGMLDKALAAARKAVAIDSQNALAFYALFTAQFHSGDLTEYRKSAAKAVMLNPNNDNLLGFYGATLSLIDEMELALGFSEKALELNASPPHWYSVPNVLEQFFQGKHEEVVKSILPTITPEFMWGHALAVASCGHMGDFEAVKDLFDILELEPDDYIKGAMHLSELWNYSPRLRRELMQGWEKAGLNFAKP